VAQVVEQLLEALSSNPVPQKKKKRKKESKRRKTTASEELLILACDFRGHSP
jgi:hypothetical protein